MTDDRGPLPPDGPAWEPCGEGPASSVGEDLLVRVGVGRARAHQPARDRRHVKHLEAGNKHISTKKPSDLLIPALFRRYGCLTTRVARVLLSRVTYRGASHEFEPQLDHGRRQQLDPPATPALGAALLALRHALVAARSLSCHASPTTQHHPVNHLTSSRVALT
jgi:hypothetical protein